MKNYYMLILLLFGITNLAVAQKFGFGCLGLSGVYGGYSIQQFDTKGIDDGISQYVFEHKGIDSQIKFDELEGYRIGANIFRARFSNFFITAKGYFQFLKQTQNSYGITDQVKDEEYALKMNHWGLGLDFGFPVCGFLDWKILEGGISFYDIDMDYQSFVVGEENLKLHYSTDQVAIGYYAGTGIIVHIIPDYMSVEGTAFYNFFNLTEFQNKDDDRFYLNNSSEKLVEGKFGASVQLNIGFPL